MHRKSLFHTPINTNCIWAPKLFVYAREPEADSLLSPSSKLTQITWRNADDNDGKGSWLWGHMT